MPCFSCICFSDGRGRNGERLNGGRGYCEIHDQEFWRGHECRNFAPVWYSSKKNVTQPTGFFNFFANSKSESDICTAYEEADVDISDTFEETEYIFVKKSYRPSRRLKKLRRHITVDDTVFKKYGLSFKPYLTENDGSLELTFEIDGSKADLSHFPKYNELILKVNVYDKKGNLLCVEEIYFDYAELKNGYISDYFYFMAESVADAHSLRIYVTETDYDEDDEEDADEDVNDLIFNQSSVAQYNDALNDSLKTLETTLYPKTYFEKYRSALYNAERIVATTGAEGHKKYASEVIRDLTDNRTEKIKSFIDRCYGKERLYSLKDELLSGKYDIPDQVKSYINELICKIENDADCLPETGEYIYCSLAFDSNGKTYYYKTTDESLKCGDEVIVPAGIKQKKAVARIVKIERFPVGKTPYPPALTKDILGKCPY